MLKEQASFKTLVGNELIFSENKGPEEVIWEFSFECDKIHELVPTHLNQDRSYSKTTPMMCRLRDLTYEVELKCNITFRKIIKYIENNIRKTRIDHEDVIPKITIAQIPVMVGSKWCRMSDCLGQSEKV